MKQWPITPQLHDPLWRHPLVLVWHHSLPPAPPFRAPRAGLPMPIPAQATTSPAAPPPPSGRLGAGPLTPVAYQTPGAVRTRSTPVLLPSSAVALVITTAQVAGRPYIGLSRSGLSTYARHPKHISRSQSLKRRDQLEGEAGGNVRPLKAMVLQVVLMCPPPQLHHSPNHLWAAMIWAPVVGRHGQAGGLPR